MRNVWLFALIGTLVLSGCLFAQQRQGGFTITGTIGQVLTFSDDDMHDSTYNLHLGYMFSDLWSAEVTYGIMDIDNGDFDIYTLDFLYHFRPEKKATPYLVFGAGSASYDPDFAESDDGLVFEAGAGFNYSLSHTMNLRGDVRYVSTDLDVLDAGLKFQMGFGLQFGGTDRPVEEGIPSVDRDMDGVSDSIDYCWDTPPRVKVDKRGCALDSDGDGTPDYKEDDDSDGVINYNDQCANTHAGFAVDTVGCPLDSDKDGLLDGREKELGTDPNKADTDGDGLSDKDEVETYHTDPLKKDTDGDGLTDGDEINIYHTDPLKADTDGDGFNDGMELLTYKTDPNAAGDVYAILIDQKMIHFDFNKSTIHEDAQGTLDEMANLLTKETNLRILIKGHTDWIGPKWYNQKLSLKRAEAARKYLADKGIAADRIDTVAFGETKPIADNKTEEGRAQNRRDEFQVQK